MACAYGLGYKCHGREVARSNVRRTLAVQPLFDNGFMRRVFLGLSAHKPHLFCEPDAFGGGALEPKSKAEGTTVST